MRGITLTSALAVAVNAQNFTGQPDPGLPSDPGSSGPTPELVHLYYDQWPTGIAVSRSGRLFSNYPPGLDAENTMYTVAELFPNNTERAFPNATYNIPPQGRINNASMTSVGDVNYLTGVQSVVVDAQDRLWMLDTGRTSLPDGTMLPASPGGPKLVGVSLETNEVIQTIVFDTMVAGPLSYLNDVRFDLSPNITESGQGVAYITDSSPEGLNAIVVVDLGTGEAWRRLVLHPSTQANPGFLPTIWGEPVYINSTGAETATSVNFGADGIALGADNKDLYYSTTGGREFYSVPTERLRDRSRNADILARGAVVYLGETGFKDGLETDTNGYIYAANIEDNSVSYFDPAIGQFYTFVRDPRFSWVDTFSVGFDGYIYFTDNQLWRRPVHWYGNERRVKPYSLFRVPLPNNGTKVL